ncbi:hypothetical protein V6N11_068150 [Hibiscus sabdariffa]|uniref:Uncharacterized protein n=1 Tax=Hibiscus sabdariffa TaxID=183260 RepID=A0ABR2STT0_9ROSI
MSREESYYEEVSMQQSFLFSDSLKDLKNLRTQLYSAAEYFELSYTNDDHKQIVVETLKDYAVRAIVNTVDHLGSVTYKVNNFLEEKVDEVSGTELRVSCVEERVRKCQEYIDHEGISQQSSMIKTPKYHKHYILPVGETWHGANQTKSKYQGCSLDGEDSCHRFRNAVRATIRETRLPPFSVRKTPASSIRRERSPSPSPRPQQRSTTFSFTATTPKKGLEKRTGSPHLFQRLSFGSDSRPTTPNKSRSSTPNPAGARQRYPSEPRKSAEMHLDSEKDNTRDIEQYPSKNYPNLLDDSLPTRSLNLQQTLESFPYRITDALRQPPLFRKRRATIGAVEFWISASNSIVMSSSNEVNNGGGGIFGSISTVITGRGVAIMAGSTSDSVETSFETIGSSKNFLSMDSMLEIWEFMLILNVTSSSRISERTDERENNDRSLLFLPGEDQIVTVDHPIEPFEALVEFDSPYLPRTRGLTPL